MLPEFELLPHPVVKNPSSKRMVSPNDLCIEPPPGPQSYAVMEAKSLSAVASDETVEGVMARSPYANFRDLTGKF